MRSNICRGVLAGHQSGKAMSPVVLVVTLCCVFCSFSASTQGSASYRLIGGTFVGVAGSLASDSYVMNAIVSQPSPVGEAEGTTVALTSGSEVPSVVIDILRFSLLAGWNLRGAPGTTQETVGEIFTGAGGSPLKVGDVYFYNTSTGEYPTSIDSDVLPGNEAFWVFSYWGGSGPEFSVTGDGTLMSKWVDSLPNGWSLFSPSIAGRIPEDPRLVSVWQWNTASGSYVELGEGDFLQMLQGYWVLKDTDI